MSDHRDDPELARALALIRAGQRVAAYGAGLLAGCALIAIANALTGALT